MKVIFLGTPEFVVPILHSLLTEHEVIGIITAPDQKVGRKQILTSSPVKTAYKGYLEQSQKTGLILTPSSFTAEVTELLKHTDVDLFVVAAYGKIIPKGMLDIPHVGALNIHPSLLPKYRGASPVQTALLNGDTETGVTIIKMDEQMDHGPLVVSEKEQIQSEDTFESLVHRLFQKSAQILPKVISEYASGEITPQPQDDKKATYCQIISKENGYFEWDNPPQPDKLDRMIRAYYPWPTAWTKMQMANGKWQIVKFLPEKRMQVEGKKPVDLKDFLNGYPQLKGKMQQLLGDSLDN